MDCLNEILNEDVEAKRTEVFNTVHYEYKPVVCFLIVC